MAEQQPEVPRIPVSRNKIRKYLFGLIEQAAPGSLIDVEKKEVRPGFFDVRITIPEVMAPLGGLEVRPVPPRRKRRSPASRGNQAPKEKGEFMGRLSKHVIAALAEVVMDLSAEDLHQGYLAAHDAIARHTEEASTSMLEIYKNEHERRGLPLPQV